MNADDPTLTACALNELDAKERTAFEEALLDDFSALAEVDATRAFAGELRTQLRAEPAAALLPSQRAAIFETVRRREQVIVPFWKRPVLLSAAAACVIVSVSIRLLWPVVSAPWKSNPQFQVRQSGPSFHFTLENGPLDSPRELLVPLIAEWEGSRAQALVGPPRIAFTQTPGQLPLSGAFLPWPRFADLNPNPPSVVRRVDEKAAIARNSDARRRVNFKGDLNSPGRRLSFEKLGAFYPAVSEEQPAFSLDSGAAVYSHALGF